MISSNIIKAIVDQSSQKNKDLVLRLFIEKLKNENPYDDAILNRVLELVVGNSNLVKPTDIDTEWININYERFIHDANKKIIKDILVESIDNIGSYVKFSYNYKEKINEFNDASSFMNSIFIINFIDNPEMLKKS